MKKSVNISMNTYRNDQLLFCFFPTPACHFGFFGQDCMKKCKETCLECTNVNGSCADGCISGWEGNFCDRGIFCVFSNIDICFALT